MEATEVKRRLPIGAEVLDSGGVHFRVWAPGRSKVEVVLEGDASSEAHALAAEEDGYHSGHVAEAREGTLYRFRLDDDPTLYPDPASRFQPDGPHGPSQVVDPSSFQWSDAEWRGIGRDGLVVYELHIGTFTAEGTWAAAARELPELAALGITAIEVMPVADFPGEFGWGYDGVDMYAPTRLYGTPDEFRAFVDRAHGEGLGVILDVVYNHLGPDGCYLRSFSPDYFTREYDNEWGDALNFDGESSGPVREFFVENAGYWIDEYHLDGLRLDATQQIFDRSSEHILSEISSRVRAAAQGRSTYIVAENEPQDVRLILPRTEGGNALDGLWNDDFHHSVSVALTGKREAYRSDYYGTPQELISLVKRGFLYQGQWFAWQKGSRGSPTRDVPPSAIVNFIQNHDQVSNSAFGERMHKLSSPGCYRAATALLLLAPGTPLLFQGQEFAASSPFLYFADHEGDLASAVRKGRAKFLTQFPSIAGAEIQRVLADPAARETFERCKLDLSERETNAGMYALHRDLLALRRKTRAIREARAGSVDGAVLADEALCLRFFDDDEDDRLLIVNLGRGLDPGRWPEPLLAPPFERSWKLVWSSDRPEYGGSGIPSMDFLGAFSIPEQSALLLAAAPRRKDTASASGEATSTLKE